MKNFAVNFNLRCKSTNNETPIFLVWRIQQKQFKSNTFLKTFPNLWNGKEQLCKVLQPADIVKNYQLSKIKLETQQLILGVVDQLENGEEIRNKIETIISKSTQTQKTMANKHPKPRQKTASKIIEQALQLDQSQRKESSQKIFKRNILMFIDFIKTNGHDSVDQLSQKGIQSYSDYLIQNGDAAGTHLSKMRSITYIINNVLCVRAEFEKYGFRRVAFNKVKDVREKDVKKNHALTIEQQAILREYKPTEKQRKWYNLMMLQLACGQRVSDLRTVYLVDITGKNDNEFVEITTKKKNTRSMISVKAIREFQQKQDISELTKFTSRAYDDTYNRYLKEIFEDAGITQTIDVEQSKGKTTEKHTIRICDAITSHWLRYTFITNCKREGMAAEKVALLSGNSVQVINQIYTDFNTSDKEKMLQQEFAKIEQRNNNQQATTPQQTTTPQPLQEQENNYMEIWNSPKYAEAKKSVLAKMTHRDLQNLRNSLQNFKNVIGNNKSVAFVETCKRIAETQQIMEEIKQHKTREELLNELL